jgi:Fe/S biogenesis protein NfuA
MDQFAVSDEAAAIVLAALREEGSPEELALWIEVVGTADGSYDYDVYFQEQRLARAVDLVLGFGELAVVVPEASVAKLHGARLEVGSDGELAIVNPNSPPVSDPLPDLGPEALANDLALRVAAVLEEQINPAIAAHGGYAELVGVVDERAYVLMGGGCQGCGLAAVTLSQGITTAIQDAVPEIREVIDVTNHAAGNNPYYQPAKK